MEFEETNQFHFRTKWAAKMGIYIHMYDKLGISILIDIDWSTVDRELYDIKIC